MPMIVGFIILIETKVLLNFLINLVQGRSHELESNIANILPALDPDFNALASVCNALRLWV